MIQFGLVLRSGFGLKIYLPPPYLIAKHLPYCIIIDKSRRWTLMIDPQT